MRIGNASQLSYSLRDDGEGEFPSEEVVLSAESRGCAIPVYAEGVMSFRSRGRCFLQSRWRTHSAF